ncbi:MAG TPA: hypothetical protein VGI63_09365 [Verrucomicrobiae bacterium]
MLSTGVCMAGGLEQTFATSYETITNKLSALKPNPAADWPSHGNELVPGKSYQVGIPEGPQGDVSGIYTTVIATKIDEKRTRVHVETIKLGLIFNAHDRKIEKQRLNELIQLLSNKSQARLSALIEF